MRSQALGLSLGSLFLTGGIALAACLGVSEAAPRGATAPSSSAEPTSERGELPPGVSQDWFSQVQREIAAREYRASENEAGLQAPNRAHDLRTYFEKTGVRVHDRTAAGSPELLSLSLGGVGRGETLAALPPGEEVVADRGRVEIRRPGIVEWYVNSPAGLEQGFTLDERPAGEGALVVQLAVGGAEARLDGDEILFETRERRTLRYGKLRVADAAGRTLAARFEVPAPEWLRIVVDDTGATYPVVIDPLLTSSQIFGDQSGARFGFSVAAAGDVNGDGFADAIVGAPYFDRPEADEGIAVVFHGSASGLGVTAASVLESNQGGAGFGTSVAGIGDVNGDGFHDVVVGAPYWDNTQTNEGAAFVFVGGPAGIVASGHPGNAAARFESAQANAQLGFSVAGAGDVNGDGYADVILGARDYDNAAADEGAAFVFHGAASCPSPCVVPVSFANSQIHSGQFVRRLGRIVAGAGDVNSDGFSDVIVTGEEIFPNRDLLLVFHGRPNGIPNGTVASADSQIVATVGGSPFSIVSTAGPGDVNGDGYADVTVLGNTAVFLFKGSGSGLPSTTGTFDDAQTIQIQQLLGLTSSIAGTDDLNGDGYADVIVGIVGLAFDVNHPLTPGEARIFYGSSSGLSPAVQTLAHDMSGGGWSFGHRVAGLGDVNGDGYADVIVGAHLAPQNAEGKALVYLGSADGVGPANPLTAETAVESNQQLAQLGASVAGAGDVNGDGFSDVIVGAPGYDNGHEDEGLAFVFHGGAGGINATTLAQAVTWLESDTQGGSLGWRVAGAGDVNGDGYGDVLVVGWRNSSWWVWVFHGGASGIPGGNVGTAATQLGGGPFGLSNLVSVAAAGDVNGDGYGDVLVGDGGYPTPALSSDGAAFVFLGSVSGIANASPASAATRLDPDQSFSEFGSSIAGAGDVNGDGYADVIVGAPFYSAGDVQEGAAFVFLGGAQGVATANASTAARLESNQQNSGFGSSVAGARDVDADGFDDVVVGAPYYDGKGAAFVFRGSSPFANGNPTTSAWMLSSQSNSDLGASVAGAGDVNGDGYADLIVSAPLHDEGETDEGAAFLIHGRAPWPCCGNVLSPASLLESNQTDAGFRGGSVAAAGDVNGDGYADVIAGAPNWTNEQMGEGGFAVYLGNGDGDGRLVWANQFRIVSGGLYRVAPWGRSLSNENFVVLMHATHPAGRGRVKLEVETCSSSVPFGSPSCRKDVSPTWTAVPVSGGGVTLVVGVEGLSAGTLHRWRARVLHAPYTVTQPGIVAPPNPAHGPWRRVAAHAGAADVRTLSFECQDGLDNDRDGLVDYPADPGCANSTDDSERTLVQPLPAGQDVAASLLGGSGVVGGIDAVFADTGGGTLAAEAYAVPAASFPPSSLPAIDFQVAGNPVLYWQLEFAGVLNGPVTLTFKYDHTTLTVPEADLRIRHYKDGKWQTLPFAPDTLAHTITVTVTSFSPFVLSFGTACSDGEDNDNDTFIDFPDDPGCRTATSTRETSQCQDGVNNDGQLGTDFDGGVSILGLGNGDPNGADPQCLGLPWRNLEAKSRCGLLGIEVLLVAPFWWLRRRKRAAPSR